jgi:hypothetical protein
MVDEELDDTTQQVPQEDAGPDLSSMLDPKALIQQQMHDKFKVVHDKYDKLASDLRSLSAPDEDVNKQEMAAEMAELKKLYSAKEESLWASDEDRSYDKKLPALKAAYQAEQFSITSKYDKLLRQQNRAYDQQKYVLNRQRETELGEIEKRSLYDAGRVHAYDIAKEKGLMSEDDHRRALFTLAGIKLPMAKKPEDQRIDFDRTTQVVNNLEQINKQYSLKKDSTGTHLMKWSVDPETGTKTTIDASQDEDEIQRFWANRRALMRMKGVQMQSAAKLGVVPPQAGKAGAYLGNGLAARAASQLSGDMGESMKSPPKTRPIEPTAPKKLDMEGRKSLIRQAGGDVNRAKQMAQAMGYE